MDLQTAQEISAALSNKYPTDDIYDGIANASLRFFWNVDVNSSCLIYSRSNNKWFIGKINKIIFRQTNKNKNEEWLIVKYNNQLKHIQRFCSAIKPIDSEY
eukprot:398483_1